MDSYKVVRAFERHDGRALRKYPRGKILTAKEAAKIPSFPTLMAGGFLNRIPEEVIPDGR